MLFSAKPSFPILLDNGIADLGPSAGGKNVSGMTLGHKLEVKHEISEEIPTLKEKVGTFAANVPVNIGPCSVALFHLTKDNHFETPIQPRSGTFSGVQFTALTGQVAEKMLSVVKRYSRYTSTHFSHGDWKSENSHKYLFYISTL